MEKNKEKGYPVVCLKTEMCMFKLLVSFEGSQMCGSGRSRPNIRRTTGLITAIKAGTTTTTMPNRRCCHCGTPVVQPYVTACKPAGKFWAKTVPKNIHFNNVPGDMQKR